MLQGQLAELRTHLEGLEKERDFYFQKAGSSSYRTSMKRTD